MCQALFDADKQLAASQDCVSAPLLRHGLHRVVEEGFFSNAFTVPALPGQLLHAAAAAVIPFKFKYPANHHSVSTDKNRMDAA